MDGIVARFERSGHSDSVRSGGTAVLADGEEAIKGDTGSTNGGSFSPVAAGVIVQCTEKGRNVLDDGERHSDLK